MDRHQWHTPGTAYALEVIGNLARGCDRLDRLNGDSVCKHRAAFYMLIGALSTPEPVPPTPDARMDCPDCNGCGVHYDRQLERLGLLYPTCRSCKGTGVIAPAERPAA